MKGFRTIGFNALVAAAAAALPLFADPSEYLRPEWVPVGVIAYSIVNMLLRAVTTTSLFSASPAQA